MTARASYAEVMAECERRDAVRAAAMPTTVDALTHAFDARERLRSLGWREGIYCPKDGTWFAIVELGSTGVHSAYYFGKWPDGNIYSGDFFVPPHAVMWKPIADLTPDERSAVDASDASARAFIDRLGAAASGEPQP